MNRRWIVALCGVAVLSMLVAAPAVAQDDEKAAKTQKSLDEAKNLCAEALPLFLEVAEAIGSLPSEQGKLSELMKKADSCENKLYGAQLRYDTVKQDAPDPEKIGSYVKRLDALLKVMRDWKKTLKAGVK